MKINPILNVKFSKINMSKINFKQNQGESYSFENPNINKKLLISRGIIGENQNINDFFDTCAKKIFQDEKKVYEFSSELKSGKISLSTSCYSDLSNPKSAIGVVLNPAKSIASHLLRLDEYIKSGTGVGINFSQFENPIDEIKQINQFFKYREKSTKRLPAGIGLLNVSHPKILDFINIKKDKDYQNWCFDFSVVIDDDFFNKLNQGDKKALEIFNQLKNAMLSTGEPGIIFSNKKDYICDCCAASELRENEELILGQVNLSKFVKNGKIDYTALRKSAKILTEAMNNINPNSKIGVLGYQDLLDKLGIKYGSNEACEILDKMLKEVKNQGAHLAISPTGATYRILKTTPSIEPSGEYKPTYYQELYTMAVAQKNLDGQISKTINLKKDATLVDIDDIIRVAKKLNLRGITVYPAQ